MVRLGDCFPYIKNGYNVRQGKDKGGMPITRIETLSDNRFNRDKVGYADIFSTEGLENRILEDGDILMSHINSLPYLGRSVMYRARPGEVFIHGMNLLRLKADRSVVEPEYAELYFRSPSFKQHVLKIAKKAVNQASFSVGNLKELEFPLMSLCDQRDVIERLSSIAAQIKHCQRAIGKLDSLVKSRFVEMFGDITEQYLLGDRLETTSGGTPSRKHPEYYEDGTIPWLTSGEVNKGKIDTPDHYITEAGLCNSSAKLVPANSVVVAMYGATAGQVGLVTYETTTNQAVCCIKPNAQVAPVFLRYALEFKKDWMIGQCAGGAQPNISQGIVKKVAIPDVTLARQQEFADFVSAVDKSRFVDLGDKGGKLLLEIDIEAGPESSISLQAASTSTVRLVDNAFCASHPI